MQGIRGRLYSRLLLVLIVILTLLLLVSTLAFWAQELWLGNEYQLGKYSTKIEQVFESPTQWLPGERINKDILVVNEGTVPAFVKAQINLNWFGQDDLTGEPYGLTFTTKETKEQEYAAVVSWGSDVVLLSRGTSSVDSLSLGLPVVDTITAANGKWLLLDEEVDKYGNLTFYYIGVLKANETTPLLIDSVEMNHQIEAKIMGTQTIYNKETKEWLTEYLINPSYSYEAGRFVLTVNALTTQATRDALRAVFKSEVVAEQAIISYLETIVNDEVGSTRTTLEKMLYFDEYNGEIQFTPINSDGQNWFMSFFEMLPGGEYTDVLMIENRSSNNYDLYMQVVPKMNQSEMLDELLQLIQMKIYLADKLIYEGTAKGNLYDNTTGDLQEVLPLGEYKAGTQNKLKVELMLSQETRMQYGDLLTKIDWRFMANEITELKPQEKPPTINQPQTDDTAMLIKYISIMLLAIMGISGCIYFLKRQQKER